MRSGVLVAATAVVLVGASSASGFVDFRTPGKAAYCYVAAGEVNYTPNPALVCFTPNDGFTVTMRSGVILVTYPDGGSGIAGKMTSGPR